MQSYDNQPLKRKTIFSLVIGFIIIVVIILILFVIDTRKTAKLNVLIAPSFAKVEIDGHTFKTKDTIKYFPGTYTAKISAEGFITQELHLELTSEKEQYLYTYLIPTDDNANFYEENENELNRYREVNEQLSDLNQENYVAKYPIVNIIPYEHSAEDRFGDPIGYRIDYGKFDGCNSDFCLQVTGYLQSNLEEAKEYIKSKGFNPDDYQILFNYTPIEKAKPEDFPESIRKIMEEAGYFDN